MCMIDGGIAIKILKYKTSFKICILKIKAPKITKRIFVDIKNNGGEGQLFEELRLNITPLINLKPPARINNVSS